MTQTKAKGFEPLQPGGVDVNAVLRLLSSQGNGLAVGDDAEAAAALEVRERE